MLFSRLTFCWLFIVVVGITAETTTTFSHKNASVNYTVAEDRKDLISRKSLRKRGTLGTIYGTAFGHTQHGIHHIKSYVPYVKKEPSTLIEKYVPVPVKIPVDRPVPVKILVDRPVPVHVPKLIPITVEKAVPVPIKIYKKVAVPVKVAVDRPIPVKILKPYPVYIEKHVPYAVDKPIPIPVKVPIDRPYLVWVEKPTTTSTTTTTTTEKPVIAMSMPMSMPVSMPASMSMMPASMSMMPASVPASMPMMPASVPASMPMMPASLPVGTAMMSPMGVSMNMPAGMPASMPAMKMVPEKTLAMTTDGKILSWLDKPETSAKTSNEESDNEKLWASLLELPENTESDVVWSDHLDVDAKKKKR